LDATSLQAATPFRYLNSSPEVIRLVVMMYVRTPLSLRKAKDLLFERSVDICQETCGIGEPTSALGRS